MCASIGMYHDYAWAHVCWGDARWSVGFMTANQLWLLFTTSVLLWFGALPLCSCPRRRCGCP